jgi:hypothetical protein
MNAWLISFDTLRVPNVAALMPAPNMMTAVLIVLAAATIAAVLYPPDPPDRLA